MNMKNNERNIFQDLPANKFHSAVFTSFMMDLSHFDNQVLRLLQEKKVCSFNILMDQRQLDQYIDFAIPSVNYVGKEYSVSGILSQGAFHPKLSMFIGEKDMLLLYGSGNLTVPGLGKNHEVFSGLYAKEEDQTQMPLIAEAWSYILGHCRNVDGYVRRRVENEIVENSSLLRQKVKYTPHGFIDIDKDLSAALLYNEENNSIFHQMVDLIPFDEVKLVTVVSPYYDDDGSTLLGLLKEAPNAKMEVLLQQECQLPPNKMKKDKRVRFMDFDMTERGGDKSYKGFAFAPFLHAKIFHFKTKTGEYCMIGSANATESALGVNGRAKNEEFCVLLYSSNRHFLKELGLTKREALELEVAEIERKSSGIKNETYFNVKIDSVDYRDGIISIYYANKTLKGGFDLMGFDRNGGQLFKKSIKLGNRPLNVEIDEKVIKQVLYFQLFDEEEKPVSNKQIVNDVEALERTTPSPRNREINRLLSKMERGNYDGLEIMEFVGDLFDEAADDEGSTVKTSIGNSDYLAKKDDTRYDKRYVDWCEEDLVSRNKGAYVTTVSKLFECIEVAIKNKTQAINEELYGEEDEGNPIESASRENAIQSLPITKNESEQLLEEIDYFVQRYIDLISLRHEQVKEAKKDVPYLNETDVKFFVLVVFSILDVCYFKRQSYEFPKSTDSNSEKQAFLSKLSHVAKRKLYQVINNFTVFSIKCGGENAGKEITELMQSCMCYVLLACMRIEKDSLKSEIDYVKQDVRLCLLNLVELFGKLGLDLIQEKMELLSKCFVGVFDTSKVLSYAQLMNEEPDKGEYKKYPNFGICLISKKGTKYLEYK